MFNCAMHGTVWRLVLCLCIWFQPGNDPYAFVEFAEHQAAAAALMAMNKRMCLGRVSVFAVYMGPMCERERDVCVCVINWL